MQSKSARGQSRGKDMAIEGTPSLAKIRFKKAAEAVTIARQIVEGLKDPSENQAKSLQEVHEAPDGLKRVLERMKNQGIKKLRAQTDEQKKTVNKKLVSPLFLNGVDIEEVNSALNATDNDFYDALTLDGRLLVEKEDYESVSQSKYDSVHDRFIFSTSIIIKRHEEPKVATAAPEDVIQMITRDLARKGKPPRGGAGATRGNQHGSGHSTNTLAPIDRTQLPSKASKIKAGKPRRQGQNLVIPSQHGQTLTIPISEADKYFGEEARAKFFDQYRAMNHTVQTIAPSGISSKYASESRIGTASAADIAYTSRTYSPSSFDDTVSSIASHTNSILDEPSYQSLSATGSVVSALHLLQDEFFQDLQSLSSNRQNKLAVDRELLSTCSFGTYSKYRNPAASAASLSARAQQRMDETQYTRLSSSVSMYSDEATLRRARFERHQRSLQTLPALTKLAAPVPASPRTKYLSGCIRDGLQPLPNLIVRRTFTTCLDFSHYSLGDRMGRVLADCLQDLPCVETINLNDNNLTDDSLQYLIEAIISIRTLRELNLSRNKIDGQSSDALAEYVSRADCPLVKLVLQNADVDDGECDRFVQCLVSNEALQELDLSANLLGSATFAHDASSTSDEGAGPRTGGHALAEFIQSTSCHLRSLSLGWNAIRGQSAKVLMQALSYNHTLTFLDLNHNGLGTVAGEVLGDALMENRVLRHLYVSGNNFTATACICICVGIVENLALTHVEMNDNPIGEVGARMIMLASMSLGSRVVLHAKNCNTIVSDAQCWYNPSQPCGEYVLRLHQPFDRAVAFHIFHIVATHASNIFSSITLDGQPLQLVQALARDRENSLDEPHKQLLANYRRLLQAASNTQLAHQLFFDADQDRSGRLDRDEVRQVLTSLGIELDADLSNDLFAVLDVDGEGSLDIQEFMSLLKTQQREVSRRIRDLVEYPILSLASEVAAMSSGTKAKKQPPAPKRYIPPRQGVLRVKMIDGFVQKKNYVTISSIDQKHAYAMAKNLGDLSRVTQAVEHNKIRWEEAYAIYQHVYSELQDKAGTLIKVLPLMRNSADARQLVTKVTGDSRVELQRIKLSFGVTFRPLLGSYNGYYCLDLSKELHRICLSRLLLESQTYTTRRRQLAKVVLAGGAKALGDLSQHGNWTCFRNEVFNGQQIELVPALFTPMPTSGILEFDFSGCPRPTGSELKLSDRRLCKVLQNICLLKTANMDQALRRLGEMKRRTHTMNQARTLFMPAYAFTVAKALEMGRSCDDFYGHLLDRQRLNRAGMKREEVLLLGGGTMSGGRRAAMVGRDPATVTGNRGEGSGEAAGEETGDAAEEASVAGTVNTEVTNDQSTDAGIPDDRSAESTAESYSDEDEDEEEEEDAGGRSAAFLTPQRQLELRQHRLADQQRRLQRLLQAKHGVSKQAKAKRLLDVIDETFNQLWLYCRHVAFIVQVFHEAVGNPHRCKHFGSYAVEVVVCLFSRIVDLHNFELIWEVLEAQDCAAVWCRIGALNLFNPLKPENTLELCIDRREERLVAKMIVYLSVVEPGLNLTFKQFQWKRELDLVPGWDVTEPWMTEEGMSQHGYFACTYYSGDGRNRNGCVPDLFLRKALTALVLLDENEVVAEDESMPEELVNTAEKHFECNRDTWVNYLAVT